MRLTSSQFIFHGELPNSAKGPEDAPLFTLESTTTFAEFHKSYLRFYGELNSSHRTILGSSNNALAVRLAIVKVVEQSISPLKNPDLPLDRDVQYPEHRQSDGAQDDINMVEQLSRRTPNEGDGHEELGTIPTDHPNDGSKVTLATESPVPDKCRYDNTVFRTVNEYDIHLRNIGASEIILFFKVSLPVIANDRISPLLGVPV